MAKLTQGTDLYFVDPTGFVVTEVACATSITGISAARDQIETTCLDGTSRTYEAGMPTPGQVSATINFDPSNASHVRLHELFVAGTKVNWAIGWSDGTAAPTVDSNGEFTAPLPTTRTYITWNGFLSDLPFDFALNSVVTSNMTIQLSDFPELSEKA